MQERVLWLLAILAGAILLVAGLWPDPEREKSEVAPSAAAELGTVRVSILNGCGAPQVAARLTRKARALGLDVINEGNAKSFGFLQSIVIDRSGDPKKASRVAALLGIPHWIQQVSDDTYRLWDVSIIIGKDYERLRLLDQEPE